ncbi:hypothetical protein ZEAMMB73_Zm00001d041300 [Zea mays]|uniref:Uncharacterized protein n=1 Tax=Zea mays TaxID=4577 RepID=A0A1D6MVF6_MAIZE|nr:hypothetical protein ZEAMMB73_Zm00001d041300 [Zea mays]
MGRGKFKGKPTGRHSVSTPEEIGNDAPARPMVPFIAAGTSGRPRTFMKVCNIHSFSFIHMMSATFIPRDPLPSYDSKLISSSLALDNIKYSQQLSPIHIHTAPRKFTILV